MRMDFTEKNIPLWLQTLQRIARENVKIQLFWWQSESVIADAACAISVDSTIQMMHVQNMSSETERFQQQQRRQQ